MQKATPHYTYLQLQKLLTEHHEQFGYEWMDIPFIGNAELFLARAGNSIIERLFTFERNGKLMSLRPEFTTMAMDKYIQDDRKETVRWQFFGATFEDIPSNTSSKFQQLSAGIELIGQFNTEIDAEVIRLAFSGVNKLGFTDSTIIVLSHVGFQQHILSTYGLDNLTIRFLMNQRQQIKTISKTQILDELATQIGIIETPNMFSKSEYNSAEYILDQLLDSTQYGATMGGRTRQNIAQRLNRKNSQQINRQQLSDAIDFLKTWMSVEGSIDSLSEISNFVQPNDQKGQHILGEWRATIESLVQSGIEQEKIRIKPDLTQNWDYYTGIVFAIQYDDMVLARGGRYDELGYLISQTRLIPAIGFAYSLDNLLV